MKNKNGISVLPLFIFIFVSFFLAIFLGVAVWGFSLVDGVLDQDIDVGNVNLGEVNNQTFGRMSDAFLEYADMIGIILMLGMVLLMFGNAYYFNGKNMKAFFIIDFLILIFIFITAVYISSVYSTLINSASILSFYIDDIPKVSTWVLNLPIYVATIGSIIMILSYAAIKRGDNEGGGVNVLGF